jgi:hypothetical protein
MLSVVLTTLVARLLVVRRVFITVNETLPRHWWQTQSNRIWGIALVGIDQIPLGNY